MSSIDLIGLFSVAGKTVLVTGGAKGIGAMITRCLVAAGCRVLVVGRDHVAANSLNHELAEYGGFEFISCDLSCNDQLADLLHVVQNSCSQLDALINNSGIFHAPPLGSVTEQDWSAVMNLNLQSPFLLIQGLCPLLEKAGTADDPARIINIGSVGGYSREKFRRCLCLWLQQGCHSSTHSHAGVGSMCAQYQCQRDRTGFFPQ